MAENKSIATRCVQREIHNYRRQSQCRVYLSKQIINCLKLKQLCVDIDHFVEVIYQDDRQPRKVTFLVHSRRSYYELRSDQLVHKSTLYFVRRLITVRAIINHQELKRGCTLAVAIRVAVLFLGPCSTQTLLSSATSGTTRTLTILTQLRQDGCTQELPAPGRKRLPALLYVHGAYDPSPPNLN